MRLQDGVAECVTERNDDQRPVLRANGQLVQNRIGIGEQVAVAEHDPFRHARGAGCEQQHGQIVALAGAAPGKRSPRRRAQASRNCRNRGTAFLRAEILGAADQHDGTAQLVDLLPAQPVPAPPAAARRRRRPAACRKTPPGIRANWTSCSATWRPRGVVGPGTQVPPHPIRRAQYPVVGESACFRLHRRMVRPGTGDVEESRRQIARGRRRRRPATGGSATDRPGRIGKRGAEL